LIRTDYNEAWDLASARANKLYWYKAGKGVNLKITFRFSTTYRILSVAAYMNSAG